MTKIEVSKTGLIIDGVRSDEELEKFYRSSPFGSINSAIGDTFYGINHRQMPNVLPINKDFYGLTFFTRPLMNMSTSNLRLVRQMIPLLTTKSESIPRIIRLLFDKNLNISESLNCPFVDNQNAFIPILTDTLVSISGWPDIDAPMFTSDEGIYKEAYSFIDGLTLNYSSFNIQATFRNIYGDPITFLFLYWLHYMSFVYQGLLVPHPGMLIQNEIDYQTRIYRFVLDVTKSKVQKWAACGAAFPYALSIGNTFNYDSEQPINESNNQISVPFKAMGAMYMEDILLDEFNRTVEMFNWNMRNENRTKYYQKIPHEYLVLFNHRGYPRINLSTNELEWWIDKDKFNLIMGDLKYKPMNEFITLDPNGGL